MGELNLRCLSADEFFEWQAKQDRLYELVDGVPVLPLKMMTGASQAHDRVVVNIIASLHRQLRGTGCRPTTDDLAVRIPSGNIRRPDVTVEYGESGPREMVVREPRVVVEVLSPSTMSFDRFRKVEEYKLVHTLVHIPLVDTEQPRITVLGRSEGGNWNVSESAGLDATIDLSEISASLSLTDIYEGVVFDRA